MNVLEATTGRQSDRMTNRASAASNQCLDVQQKLGPISRPQAISNDHRAWVASDQDKIDSISGTDDDSVRNSAFPVLVYRSTVPRWARELLKQAWLPLSEKPSACWY